MNYYERHLGDYVKKTAHLSMIEDGAYNRLLDRYYDKEEGIPADQVYRVTRARTKEERAAVETVLNEFFVLVDNVWRHERADKEITKAQTKIKAARENGLKGGRPKQNPTDNQNITDEKPTGLFLGSENETQKKALQTPVSNLQSQRRATRIPDDFLLTEDRSAIARAEGLNPERTIAKFRDYWASKPGKDAAKLDWDATWRNWCRSEHDRNPQKNNGSDPYANAI